MDQRKCVHEISIFVARGGGGGGGNKGKNGIKSCRSTVNETSTWKEQFSMRPENFYKGQKIGLVKGILKIVAFKINDFINETIGYDADANISRYIK